MIDLHYWPTPNGKKLTIQLEECGIDYTVIYCEIGRGAQFEEEFLRISPNNRMPAIVDHDPRDSGGPSVRVRVGSLHDVHRGKDRPVWRP